MRVSPQPPPPPQLGLLGHSTIVRSGGIRGDADLCICSNLLSCFPLGRRIKTFAVKGKGSHLAVVGEPGGGVSQVSEAA